jgi:hypothetical protein
MAWNSLSSLYINALHLGETLSFKVSFICSTALCPRAESWWAASGSCAYSSAVLKDVRREPLGLSWAEVSVCDSREPPCPLGLAKARKEGGSHSISDLELGFTSGVNPSSVVYRLLCIKLAK